MSDAKAGVLVMLAGVAMALVGVFMWQGRVGHAHRAGTASRVSWNNAFPHFSVEDDVNSREAMLARKQWTSKPQPQRSLHAHGRP